MPAAIPSHSDDLPRGAVAALALAAFGSGMSLRVNDTLLPKLAEEFSVSIGQASMVISIFAISYGLAQLIFGPFGDRYGKYRVIAWACLASAFTALLCGIAPNFAALCVSRALAGFTAAVVIPLAMAWIGDVVPYEGRQAVLAKFLIGQILGLAAGVWVGGYSADHLSWRTPYLALSGYFACIALTLFWLNPRLPARARLQRPAQNAMLKQAVSEFSKVLARPWARVVLLTVALEGMLLYGPFAFIATHLHLRHGLSLSASGALVMLFGLGGFVFASASSQFVRHMGEVGLARWGGVVMCAALLVVGLSPVWWLALPGCLLMGLGFYMLHNTLQVNATQMAPERRGAAVSAFASCFFLGQSLGVSLAGAAVVSTGTAPLLVIGALGVLAVAFYFAALLQRRQPQS